MTPPPGGSGIDIAEGFQPIYVVSADRTKLVRELKAKLKDADELLLATDEDREGEAIAWHLLEVLQPKVPVRRMVFHEITRDAIQRAAEETRAIDDRLVDAQEARRIIDRLYGYGVSPVLWRKIASGLSAGRVQSVATRLVVERERERIAFTRAGYWDLEGVFDPGSFKARLHAVDGARVASGKDFGSDGRLKAAAVALDEAEARSLAAALEGAAFTVRSVDTKPYRRSPAAPFMTSTLQQEASRKLRMSSKAAMRTAQALYENGYITYMRTDSTTLSASALSAARDAVVAGLRPRVPRRVAAAVRPQGEERPGGPRGDPPGRRGVPHPRRGRRRADPRPARAVRPDLEAHRRLADGRRPRADGVDAPRGTGRRRPRRGVRAPAARSSPSAASWPPTRRAATTTPTSPSGGCRRWPRATS